MRRFLPFACLLVFAVGCKSSTEGGTTDNTSTTGGKAPSGAFAGVQTILNTNCVRCHGERGKDGIDLRSYESLMKGGEDGPIVTAGDPASSVIIQALRGTNGKKQMPSKAPPLSEDDIKKVEDWIKDGAKA